MPNDCWNHITFTSDPGDLYAFINIEFKDTPEWALSIKKQGSGAVFLRLWSRWLPDFVWLEGLLTKYPSCWIKNEWNEEGGTEGVWVGSMRTGKKQIQRMVWEGMCIEEEYHRFKAEYEVNEDTKADKTGKAGNAGKAGEAGEKIEPARPDTE